MSCTLLIFFNVIIKMSKINCTAMVEIHQECREPNIGVKEIIKKKIKKIGDSFTYFILKTYLFYTTVLFPRYIQDNK